MTPAEKLSVRVKRERKSRPFGRKIIWNCKLAERRTSLGLTLRDVEAGTGISNAVISHVERGTDPTLSTALSIATFFGCSVEEMWPKRA